MARKKSACPGAMRGAGRSRARAKPRRGWWRSSRSEPRAALGMGGACAATSASLLTRHARARRRAFRRPLGDSSTVEQRTLTPSILVRIQVPQPLDLIAYFGDFTFAEIVCFGVHFGKLVANMFSAVFRRQAAAQRPFVGRGV